MENVTTQEDSLKDLLAKSYGLFGEGDFTESEKYLEKALSIDLDNAEVLSALKCAHFWKSRSLRVDRLQDPLERGEYFMKEWRNFDSFSRSFLGRFGRCLLSIKLWVFGRALASYKGTQQEDEGLDREILFRIGRCYKALGNYEKALALLEMSNNRKREDPEILAELADTYALINEMKASKVFFREAFFLDPQKVDLLFLESEMLRRLVRKIKSVGIQEKDMKEWIPVYGVIFGVLNVKRELNSLEYGKLRQSIYALENEVNNGQANREEVCIPRLLNRYFWLIDHYLITNEPREKIEEVLEKIKILDNSIYTQLSGRNNPIERKE